MCVRTRARMGTAGSGGGVASTDADLTDLTPCSSSVLSGKEGGCGAGVCVC